jgi:glycosyltransferase involved in cell wall biosynthesis
MSTNKESIAESLPQGPRVLFLRVGVFMSMQDINIGKYHLLSRRYSGEILEKVFRKELSRFEVGRFDFRGFHIAGLTRSVRALGNLLFGGFVLTHALRQHLRGRRYDYIVTYDPFSAGLLGLILSKLLGCKLVCEVNGNYGEAKTWVGSEQRLLGLMKYYYCRLVIPLVLNRAHAIKLLYPAQLQPFGRRIRATNIHVFHEFTPVLTQRMTRSRGDYVLFLGSPWDLKGVDVLIKGWRRISPGFPQYRLRVVGWFPEPGMSHLRELAGDDASVQIEKAVHYEEAMRLVANAYAVVLPSRSEAMGRVLLEGMAYGKPVVASRVDGIPTYVKERINGLLFESENSAELAQRLADILADPDAAARLGEQAYDYVRAHLSEEKYLEYYHGMLTGATGRVWI